MQSFSIADARAQLPKIIHNVETGDITQLTRRGKPVAVLLSLKEYEALLSQGKGGLIQALSAFQALQLTDVEDIADKTVDNWRDKSTGRDTSWL
jgi:prevent-host-death family protein